MSATRAHQRWMRLRRDTGGEVSVFEDLQTLVVVVAAVAVLLGSVLYNWSALNTSEGDQELYDEAEHIVEQIEANDHLRAVNNFGSQYAEPLLRQPELVRLVEDQDFEEIAKTDLHYNVTFDDLSIGPGEGVRNDSLGLDWRDAYSFGEPVPQGKDTAVLAVQYALVMAITINDQEFDVSERHPCLVTVVVWR